MRTVAPSSFFPAFYLSDLHTHTHTWNSTFVFTISLLYLSLSLHPSLVNQSAFLWSVYSGSYFSARVRLPFPWCFRKRICVVPSGSCPLSICIVTCISLLYHVSLRFPSPTSLAYPFSLFHTRTHINTYTGTCKATLTRLLLRWHSCTLKPGTGKNGRC